MQHMDIHRYACVYIYIYIHIHTHIHTHTHTAPSMSYSCSDILRVDVIQLCHTAISHMGVDDAVALECVNN